MELDDIPGVCTVCVIHVCNGHLCMIVCVWIDMQLCIWLKQGLVYAVKLLGLETS